MKLRVPAAKLKELRQSFKLSQNEFAEAINVSQAEISLLEAGKRKFLILNPQYLAGLDEGALSWMLRFAAQQLRHSLGVRLMTGTISKSFGCLPISYIERNLNNIVDATMAEIQKQIENIDTRPNPLQPSVNVMLRHSR